MSSTVAADGSADGITDGAFADSEAPSATDFDHHGAPASRRWRRGAAITAAACIGVAGVAGWVLLGSPWLHASTVVVSGVSAGLESNVRQVADVPEGGPLITVDTAAVASRIGAMPEVASVSVTRAWPDTVAIAVEPRTPVAYISGGAGGDLVDATGRAFASVSEAPTDLPQLSASADTLAQLATVAAELPPVVRSAVGGIAMAPDGIRLTLRDDSGTVLWGDQAASAEKARILAVLLQAAGLVTTENGDTAGEVDTAANAQTSQDTPVPTWFDVSVPAAPVTALAEPQRATSAEIKAAQEKQLAQLQQEQQDAGTADGPDPENAN